MAEAFLNRFVEACRVRGVDLTAQCEHVPMPTGTILFEAGAQPRYVHFVTSGLSSIVTTMRSGDAVEVGMSAYEGFAETNPLLGPQCGNKRSMTQVGGSALRMDFARFRALFLSNEAVRDLALQLIQYESLCISQVAACNGLHNADERLARWLVMVQDRIGTPELPLTQEFLADMLGTRRSTVTMSAGSLQRTGIIEYHRGLIRVVQRDRLRDVACECYGVLEAYRQNLYR